MRGLLKPLVALVTFFTGISVAAIVVAERQERRPTDSRSVSSCAAYIPLQVSFEIEKYAVYSALIKDMYVEDGGKLLVVRQQPDCRTPSDNRKVEELRRAMEAYAIKKLPELEGETIHDFHAPARGCRSMDRKLDIPIEYVLATDKELEPSLPETEYDGRQRRFDKKFPESSGIISFSNVGFNREMTQALVSTSRSCGGLCGAGHYVLLTKENGVWKVHSKTMTWVS